MLWLEADVNEGGFRFLWFDLGSKGRSYFLYFVGITDFVKHTLMPNLKPPYNKILPLIHKGLCLCGRRYDTGITNGDTSIEKLKPNTMTVAISLSISEPSPRP